MEGDFSTRKRVKRWGKRVEEKWRREEERKEREKEREGFKEGRKRKGVDQKIEIMHVNAKDSNEDFLFVIHFLHKRAGELAMQNSTTFFRKEIEMDGLLRGSRWLCHLSRHCFPVRDPILEAMKTHFSGPYSFTKSRSFLSSYIIVNKDKNEENDKNKHLVNILVLLPCHCPCNWFLCTVCDRTDMQNRREDQ
jgi:hypothetical protein